MYPRFVFFYLSAPSPRLVLVRLTLLFLVYRFPEKELLSLFPPAPF